MNADQLSRSRDCIQRELEELKGKAATTRGELLRVAEVQPPVLRDGLDHAKEEADLGLSLELSARDLLKRSALLLALAKIAHGSFGRCERCENEINERRLEAFPSARLCTKCQTGEERAQAAVVHPSTHFRSPPVPDIFGSSAAWLHAVGGAA